MLMRLVHLAGAAVTLAACGTQTSSDVASLASEFGANCGAPYELICGRFSPNQRAWNFQPAQDMHGPYLVAGTTDMVNAVSDVMTNANPKALVCGKIEGGKVHLGSSRIVTNSATCNATVR